MFLHSMRGSGGRASKRWEEKFILAAKGKTDDLPKRSEEFLQEFKYLVYRWKRNYGLSKDDSYYVLVDTLMKVTQLYRDDRDDPSFPLPAYVKRIGRNLCIDQYRFLKRRSDRFKEEIPEKDGAKEILDYGAYSKFKAEENKKDNIEWLELALSQCSSKCQDLLKYWAYHDMCMEAIADLMGYKDAHTASCVKYQCIRRLQDLISRNGHDFRKGGI